MIAIEQLSVSYGTRAVLRTIELEARSGELIGLIGPNGAGKSTLVRTISGVIAPSHGRIMLEQHDLASLSQLERARRIAVVPQQAQLPEAFSAGEVVLMGRMPHLGRFASEGPADYAAARAAMEATSISAFANRPVAELSGGEQQRVLIARALAQEPQVLLLDEATAHLDLRHQTATLGLMRQLTNRGLLVIAALHDLNLAALYADRLALLCDGELLICAPPEQVLTPEWIRRAYGVAAVITPHPIHGTPLVALVAEEEKP